MSDWKKAGKLSYFNKGYQWLVDINNLEENYDLDTRYKFVLGGHTTLRGWAKPSQTEKPDGALISNILNK